ncbi:MAG: hypothetical protein HY319_22125 [Armatimonadetes bacterium]|nr:hypothetical protein [Armatimonadota bacterium]
MSKGQVAPVSGSVPTSGAGGLRPPTGRTARGSGAADHLELDPQAIAEPATASGAAMITGLHRVYGLENTTASPVIQHLQISIPGQSNSGMSRGFVTSSQGTVTGLAQGMQAGGIFKSGL